MFETVKWEPTTSTVSREGDCCAWTSARKDPGSLRDNLGPVRKSLDVLSAIKEIELKQVFRVRLAKFSPLIKRSIIYLCSSGN